MTKRVSDEGEGGEKRGMLGTVPHANVDSMGRK